MDSQPQLIVDKRSAFQQNVNNRTSKSQNILRQEQSSEFQIQKQSQFKPLNNQVRFSTSDDSIGSFERNKRRNDIYVDTN